MHVSVKFHATAALPPGKELPVPTGEEAERSSELVETRWRTEKFFYPYRE
jgi:hypothetical protein